MKLATSMYCAALLGAPFFACQSAAAVLVGAGVNNGDFNDTPAATDANGGATFADTPFWTDIGTGGFTATTTFNFLYDSTRNMYIRQHSDGFTYAANATGYTIAAGDVFNVSYLWLDGSGWTDASDQVTIVLYTTSDNIIGGTQSILQQQNSGISTSNTTWEAVVQNSFYTAVAADAGKKLFVGVTSISPSSTAISFARIENLNVEVVPEPGSLALLGLSGLIMVRRRRA